LLEAHGRETDLTVSRHYLRFPDDFLYAGFLRYRLFLSDTSILYRYYTVVMYC
jgi:hypothetical protein